MEVKKMGLLEWLGFGVGKLVCDSSKEEQKHKKIMTDLKKSYYFEISNSASKLFEEVVKIANRADSNNTPSVIIKGSSLLPIYAFLKVIEEQNFSFTSEQNRMIDVYFNTITLDFTKYDFLNAIKTNDETYKNIESVVDISNTYVGEFWKTLYELIYEITDDSDVLSPVINCFCNMVGNFIALGDCELELSSKINNNFVEGVCNQFDKFHSMPTNDVDSSRHISYKKHFENMKKIAQEIVDRGEEEDILVINLFDFFVVGLLYTLIEKSNTTTLQQIQILNSIMCELNININFNGSEIIEKIEAGDELRKLTYDLVNDWDDLMINYWKIQGIAAQKSDSGQLTLKFVEECLNFFNELEEKLKKDYQNVNFGKLGFDIIINVSEKMRDIYSNRR